MTYAIGECSPEVKAKITTWADNVGISNEETRTTKYPFKKLAIGQSFAIPFEEVQEAGLRTLSSKYSKQLGKTFTVIKHTAHSCYEVARTA